MPILSACDWWCVERPRMPTNMLVHRMLSNRSVHLSFSDGIYFKSPAYHLILVSSIWYPGISCPIFPSYSSMIRITIAAPPSTTHSVQGPPSTLGFSKIHSYSAYSLKILMKSPLSVLTRVEPFKMHLRYERQ